MSGNTRKRHEAHQSGHSTGVTAQERFWARLSRTTFLSPWAYSNPFRDKLQNGVGHGKELCDILVVFDDSIILLSDKRIRARTDIAPELSWSRWYRSAVSESMNQLYAAERWLQEYPERVFIDRACTMPLPVPLPPEPRRVFRIAVTGGSTEAATAQFGVRTGFAFSSDAVPPVANRQDEVRSRPFCLGRPNPEKPFCHIFDEHGMESLLSELDTVEDFLGYLKAREHLLNSRRQVNFLREQDLLALHIAYRADDSEGYFDASQHESPLNVLSNNWEKVTTSKKYKERRQNDAISYKIWDHIIEQFAHFGNRNMLIGVDGQSNRSLDDAELGLRLLAKESRFERTVLSGLLWDSLNSANGLSCPFTRTVLSCDSSDRVYVFSAACPSSLKAHSESEYQERRRGYLRSYCDAVANRYRGHRWIVGIATEPSSFAHRSYDLVVVDNTTLTAEDRATIDAATAITHLHENGRIKDVSILEAHEYGTCHIAASPWSRRAKVGRNDLCPCGSKIKYKNCCLVR